MSSRKRPLSELRNSNAQTPSTSRSRYANAYAPSTPHAIHALQQRSGAKTRSTRRPRAFSDSVRPDSARGILRRLAKITAPQTKRSIPTPANAHTQEKENQTPRSAYDRDGDDEDATDHLKRPRLALDLDDSLDDVGPPTVEEEEDSELPEAPTPAILPGEDDDDDNNDDAGDQGRSQRNDPTITFKSIDFARERETGRKSGISSNRRWSKGSDQQQDNGMEEEATILTEMGRRAISEEPTGRLSRYSFGSIRMSDFGSELEIRRQSAQQEQIKTPMLQNEYSGIGLDYEPLDLGGETEHLERLGRPSPSLPPLEESTMNIQALEESFQLEISDAEAVSGHAQTTRAEENLEGGTPPANPDRVRQESLSAALSDPEGSLVHEVAPSSSRPRRKNVKLTRDGEVVPSLPSSVIRRVAIEAHARLGNRKPKLGRDHMQALEQATEWFFEQVGEDLAAYSDHARRKKRVDHSDVLMLMRRQRVLQGDGELRKAVQELLPEEAAAELEGAIK